MLYLLIEQIVFVNKRGFLFYIFTYTKSALSVVNKYNIYNMFFIHTRVVMPLSSSTQLPQIRNQKNSPSPTTPASEALK